MEGTNISLNIDIMLLFKDFAEVVSESLVKVFTTEVSVTRGSNDFENSVIDCKQRNIKSTTTEIKHNDILLALLFIESICNGRS